MNDSIERILEFSKEKAYKAIDTLSIEMRNRRYEIRMNQSGKKVFLSINNRSKLLTALYNCMIHQNQSARISSINVYTGIPEIVELTVNQLNSILIMLDKKNDEIDIMISDFYKKIRDCNSLNKLNLVIKEIVDKYNDESKHYYGSMK